MADGEPNPPGTGAAKESTPDPATGQGPEPAGPQAAAESTVERTPKSIGEPATHAAAGASAAPTAEPERPPSRGSRVARRFGRPGRPLPQNPFMIGLFGGLGVLVAYSAFLAARNAAGMLVLIFIALFLAIALNPAVVQLQRWGLRRGLAVGVVGIGVVLLFCGGLYSLVPPVVNQSAEFVDKLPDYIEDLKRNQTLNELNARYDIIDRLQSAASAQNITKALGGVLGGAQLVFGTFFKVLTVFVLTIYFMISFDRIKQGAYQLVPASRRQRVVLLGDEILGKVGAYMVGALAIAVLAGVSTFTFLMILGVAYPFALAFVVAICDLIPQIGATLGAVVVSIVGVATSVPVGIACVVFFVIYQQLENYLIYPQVMRRSVKVSNVAALVAALLGVSLLGVIGALVAIPAVAAVQLIGREVIIPRQGRH